MVSAPDPEQIRTRDIEQPDQAERERSHARGDAAIHKIGWEMRGNKRDVEAADKEAEVEQPIVAAACGAAQCGAQWLACGRRSPDAQARIAFEPQDREQR